MNCYVIEKGGQNVFLFTFCFLSVEDTKLSTNKQNSLSVPLDMLPTLVSLRSPTGACGIDCSSTMKKNDFNYTEP
jgi:hypothetical protein